MAERREIFYQPVWGRLFMTLAVVFAVIFIVGALFLYSFGIFLYLVLPILIFVMGWGMVNKPYASYTDKDITLYSFWGPVRKRYRFNTRDEIKVKGNNLYQGNKKLKVNSWFLNKEEWKRLVRYYSDEEAWMDELVDED